MRPFFVIAALLFFFAEESAAQRLQDWLNLGDDAIEQNDPYGALKYYGMAMNIDSSKGIVKFKYAEALRLNQNYSEAAYYYHDVYRRERGKIFPLSGIWLASMQKQAGNYKEAKQNWRRVRNQFNNQKNSYWYQKAVQEMRSCDLAMEWSENQAAFELDEVSEPVNTDQSEFSGYFMDDGRLAFTALRGNFNDKGELITNPDSYLPVLYLADSTLNSVEEFTELSVSKPSYNYSASSDKSKIATATINESGQSIVLILNAANNTKVLQIPSEADTSWYSQPSFGVMSDREILFFSSDKAGGYGQKDIWYIFLDTPTEEPVNAGKYVNSPGNEISPFYRADQEKLYFASDWHYGFGGYDIFESDIIGNNPGFPENLKQPFNTGANDLYYSFNQVLGKGTISSNRMESKQNKIEGGCCNDLWLFYEQQVKASDTIPEITTLEELNDYLPVTLYFHNDEPDPRTRKESTNRNYLDTYRDYVSLLPVYREEYRAGLNEDAGDAAEEAMDQFFINEIDEGVENLERFTNLLHAELLKGQKVVVTVKGFASPLAETDYNVKLTSRRISSLENYLRGYERSALLPYFDGSTENGGTLAINKIPFGEYIANKVVSDNPNERNAIFSIAAALERKIEIVSVQRAQTDTTLAEIRFASEIQDFGLIQNGTSIPFSFDFSYVGTLVIDSITSNTDQINVSDYSFRNGSGEIKGVLNPKDQTGKQNSVISIYANIPEKMRELNLTFEIE